MLILHICIALMSLVVSTSAVVFPRRRTLSASYGLVGLTLLTGTYLVVTEHVALLRVCMSGLVYLALSTTLLVIAHRRLAQVASL